MNTCKDMITKHNAYHRTEVSSSWEVALRHGNTVERTQTACYKDRSHLYCWCSHTCLGRRPGCKVRGLSDWCRSSRALNARSGHRWFAERGKETNKRDNITLLQMFILQSITIANTKKLTNSLHDSSEASADSSSSS